MSIVASTTGFSSSSDNHPTVNKPAGVGDVYVLTISGPEAQTVTWPAGFTEIAESGSETTLGSRIRTALRTYTGTESATFVSTLSGFAAWMARCSLITGVSTTLADSDSTGNYSGNVSTVSLTGGSVTTGAANRYVLWIASSWVPSGDLIGAATSYAPPSGFTVDGSVFAAYEGNFIGFWTKTEPTNTTGAYSGSATYSGANTRSGLTATLVFAQLPIIDTQPADQTIYQGQGASFTVAATTSGGSLSYQWKDDGSNVGTNSTTYAPTPALSDSGSLIRCDVTDDNGTRSTNNALLTVLPSAITAWWSA